MYEFIIIEHVICRARMPAAQPLHLAPPGCFMKNVTHFVYNVSLLFEALCVPVLHEMGPHNGGKIKEAIFHFVPV